MMPPSIMDAVRVNAQRHPRKIALVDANRILTYQDFYLRICAIAGALAKCGVRKGSRSIVAVGNRCEHVESLLAVTLLGGIPVPIDILSRTEFGRICDIIDPVAIIAEQEFLECVGEQEAAYFASIPNIMIGPNGTYDELIAKHQGRQPKPPSVNLEDPFLYMTTSGTTGAPKYCSISHGAYAMRSLQKSVEDSVRTTDRHLSILPICFNAGRGAALAHLYMGATTVLLSKFDPDRVAHIVRAENITTLMVVPRICAKLLETSPPREASASLRRVSCTGAAMPIEIKGRFLETICANLFNSYGSTDTGPIATLGPRELIVKHGSVGQPTWGVEVAAMDEEGRIVPRGEEGELVCRSPYLIDGYLGGVADAPSFSDGWFPTGDVGSLDGDGYIYLQSRRKEIIKSGGTTIYPVEIEEAIRRHPGVSDASVFGIPSTEWGESVVAAVVAEPSQRVTPEELISFCKSRLARYKAPKEIVVVAQLPYTSMGKVNKRELAALFAADAEKSTGVGHGRDSSES